MPDLTGLKALLNRNRATVADNREGRRNNARASRRHSKILNAHPDTLIALNRGSQATELDLAPDVTSIEAEVQIALLDRLIARERRGPHAVRFDTSLLLKRARRGPKGAGR